MSKILNVLFYTSKNFVHWIDSFENLNRSCKMKLAGEVSDANVLC